MSPSSNKQTFVSRPRLISFLFRRVCVLFILPLYELIPALGFCDDVDIFFFFFFYSNNGRRMHMRCCYRPPSFISRILSVHIAFKVSLNRLKGSSMMNVYGRIVKRRIILFVTFKFGDKKKTRVRTWAIQNIWSRFVTVYRQSRDHIWVRYYERTVLTVSRKRLAVFPKTFRILSLLCYQFIVRGRIVFSIQQPIIRRKFKSLEKHFPANICRPHGYVQICGIIGLFSRPTTLDLPPLVCRLNDFIVFIGDWPSLLTVLFYRL